MSISTRSAFPAPVEDLMPAARDLTRDLGAVPSRNHLMRELKVGADKANAVRAELAKEVADRIGAHREPIFRDLADRESDPDPTEGDTEDHEQPAAESTPEAAPAADPGVTTPPTPVRTLSPWPVLLLALPAFVAIWSGWVGLGSLTGFGPVHPLPGIWDSFEINSAITLPIGMETYAAYALRVWLTPGIPAQARAFARWSAIGSLGLGAAGQVAYHLMTAAGLERAPWQITTLVSCLPVAVAGMGAALARLVSRTD